MTQLTTGQFLPIMRKILDFGFVAKLQQEGTLMLFLSSIWELRALKSIDERYTNLYDDIKKHWIDNSDDYDDDNLFFTRLNLLDDGNRFIPFLESCVNYQFWSDETYRQALVKLVNDEIEQYKLQLTITALVDGKGCYKIMDLIAGMDTSEVARNEIPFYVEKNPSGYSHHLSSHTPPADFPAFVLVSDDGWSDGYAHIQFNLYLYYSATNCYSFGLVKIIKKESDMECKEENPYYVKNDALPNVFNNLPSEFCSLGQDSDYYSKIKSACPENYMSVFLAMRDVAVFSQFDDEFKNTKYYDCLVRSNVAERNIREARLKLEGISIYERYSFDYTFQPEFAENDISFHFKFKNPEQILARRIYAIIGKNGVGKTMFISKLPQDLASQSNEHFNPRKPIISKVISISESNFDNFRFADNNTRLNYVHCGMVKQGDEVNIPKTKAELTSELLSACKRIKYYGRVNHLRRVLNNLINTETLSQLFLKTGMVDYELKDNNLSDLMKRMSSGESIMFYLFCMLEAEMRFDSLVLLDEPETHLHPNAMSELICALDDILMEYESCCIIVTHSPLLVRELSSDCVYVMEREENVSFVRKPGIETLGGNLTTLTDDIFGSSEVHRNYKRRIAQLVREGVSYEHLISLVKSEDLPLGIGIELYIRSLYQNNTNE